MTRTTRAQRETLARKAAQSGEPYRALRGRVQGTVGCDGAVVVQWCGMWLCIESDGYAHT